MEAGVEALRKLLLSHAAEEPPHHLRMAPAELEGDHLQQHVLEADGRVAGPRRQQAPQPLGDRVDRRAARPRMSGERCSIVTWAAFSAIAGTSVIAVEPEPITTTRLPS